MLSPSSEAVERRATPRSASATALAMNGEVRQLGARRARTRPSSPRATCATRVKLTSNTECTCADVRRLSTMCSAIFLRMTAIGTISTRSRRTVNAGTWPTDRRLVPAIRPVLQEAEDVVLGDAAADAGARAGRAISTLCSLAIGGRAATIRVRRGSSVRLPLQASPLPPETTGWRRGASAAGRGDASLPAVSVAGAGARRR